MILSNNEERVTFICTMAELEEGSKRLFVSFYTSGQEKKSEIQLPSGPVHFSFQLPTRKYNMYLPNTHVMFMPYQLHHLLGTVSNQ